MKQLSVSVAALGATEFTDKWLSRGTMRDFLDAIDVTDGVTRIAIGFMSLLDYIEVSGLLIDLLSMLSTVSDLVIA